MKFFNKCIAIIYLCMLSCVLLSGCEKKLFPNIDNETTIEEVRVDFDDYNGERKMVIVNLLENTKTTILFQKEVNETTEDFKVDDTFSEFIKKTVFSSSTVNAKDSTKKTDEQKVLWNIAITTNDDYYNFQGFYEFPSYWDELLEYMGER